MAGLLAASIAGCGGSGNAEVKPQHVLTTEESTLIELTNRVRIEENLEPLNVDQGLCQLARTHAARLAQSRTLKIPERESLAAELTTAGYPFTIWGINIARYDQKLEDGFIGLMQRGRTQVEILQAKYDDIGVGIAKAEGENGYYLVQLFGSKRNK